MSASITQSLQARAASLICHMDADISVERSPAIGQRIDVCVANI